MGRDHWLCPTCETFGRRSSVCCDKEFRCVTELVACDQRRGRSNCKWAPILHRSPQNSCLPGLTQSHRLWRWIFTQRVSSLRGVGMARRMGFDDTRENAHCTASGLIDSSSKPRDFAALLPGSAIGPTHPFASGAGRKFATSERTRDLVQGRTDYNKICTQQSHSGKTVPVAHQML